MALTDIRLQNFRSYADDSFELSPGVNIIVGPNASGKTNLLEAILVLARGGSYRAKDAELVRFGSPWARLDTHAAQDDESDTTHERTLKIECNGLQGAASGNLRAVCKKSFVIDGQTVLRMTQPKMLPAVLFEPNHLLLLTGSPELRRSYLDDLIEQTMPGFGPVRRQYKRVLAQRNALLKRGSHVAGPQIFVWNLRLSELAGRIVQERLELIERINQVAGETYSRLAHAEADVLVNYTSSLDVHQYESSLLKKLEHNLERDCILGFTTAGPHREDINVLLNGHTLQDAASRGETRTIILALKIIELQLIEAARGSAPLLLLDDVFSELDGARRQALTEFLRDYQTFITTTDADVVVQHFMDECNIIPTAY
jgi:DNA replication and repair protein RecF